MVYSLEEFKKLKEKGEEVTLTREVRYYASYGGLTYALIPDWETELLTEKLDRIS